MKDLFEKLNKIDDARSLNEYYDEEAPLGRHELYPDARVKPMSNRAPQWWLDKGGNEDSWKDAVRNDRSNNSHRNAWEEVDKKQTTTLTEEEASTEGIIDKLRKISNYESFIKALKSLNDQQKKLFITEFGNVDAIKPATNKTGIAVTKLRPTQSEIDWKKSLSYGLGQDCSYFFDSPVELGMPVLTYNETYIIDGHHRWSQVFMFNPKAQVSCIDFKYSQASPTDVLKDFQGAVLATTGNVAVGTAGTNIWSVSENELRSYISENISDACWNSLVKAGVAKDKESAINYIVNNAMILKNKIKPAAGAPDRVDMPQTNNNVIAKAAKSLSDMSEGYDDDISSLENLGYSR